MAEKKDAHGKGAQDRGLIPTFLNKTYALVNDKENSDIVSWGKEQGTFIIHDANRFARDVLPQYFKQNKMSSFVRQLNMYGFHKKTSPESKEHIFYHPMFIKGSPHSLNRIGRKKNSKRNTQENTSVDSRSIAAKSKKSRFYEEMTKHHVEVLEQRIKELVNNYSHLLDQCKQLALELNDAKKGLNKKIEMITMMIVEIMRCSTQNSAPPYGASANQANDEHSGQKDQFSLSKIEDLNDQKQYRLVDNMSGNRDVLRNILGYKGQGSADVSTEVYKNSKPPVFANPNNLKEKDKIKNFPQHSPRELMEHEEKVSRSEFDLGAADSLRLGMMSPFPGHGQYSTDNEYGLMELQKMNSNTDSLCKRPPMPLELDILQSDSSRHIKKKGADLPMESLHSPQVNGFLHSSLLSSPSHSTAGFKLHPSRKNSDLSSLNGEPKLSKKMSQVDG